MLIEDFIVYFNGEQLPDEFWDNLNDGGNLGEIKFFDDIELNTVLPRHNLILDIENKIFEAYLQKTLNTEEDNEFFVASGLGSSENENIWAPIKASYVSPFSDETTDDITGNDNNPTTTGDVINYSQGLIGKAANFSGSNNLKFTQDLYGVDGFSVNLWFNASNISGVNDRVIWSNSNNSDVWCKLIIDMTGDLILSVKTPGGNVFNSSPIAHITTDSWNQVVVVYNTLDKFDVYFNGVLGGSLEIDPLDVYVPQANTYIASDHIESTSNRFVGKFDEIRFIKDMIDLNTINAEYNNKTDTASFYTRVKINT